MSERDTGDSTGSPHYVGGLHPMLLIQPNIPIDYITAWTLFFLFAQIMVPLKSEMTSQGRSLVFIV